TSGVLEVRYSNDGISWSSWEAANPTKAWVLSTGDSSSKAVYYEIKDNAGRVSQYTDTIGLDTVDPTGSVLINNGDVWTNSTNVILTLTYSDLTSGISEVRYSNDGITWSSWEVAGPTKAWMLSAGDNSSKAVYYEIRDNAGRVSQYTDTIGLDTVDPTGSVVINGDDVWTNSTNVILTLTYNDATSGISEVRYSNDGISWISWEAVGPTRAWILYIGDGSSKIVYYEIKDHAGRVSQYTDTIGLDTVDPTGSIMINNGDVWTNSTNVILTLTYSDVTSGISEVRYSNDGITWSSWEAVGPTRAWILYIGDGSSKIVYYEIKDHARRVSQYTDTIGLDTVDPTGSIMINDGDTWTNSTNVILTLTYNDATSGISEVRYSNDGISWSSWEAESFTKAWTLIIGDGSSKIVYYEIKDHAGRVSQYTDIIGLDTVDPVGSVVINNDDNWTISSGATLTLTYDDVTSGVYQVRYSNDGVLWSSWEAASPTKAWMLSAGDGPSKMVYYEIRDNAGRVSQYADSIGLDTVDPTGSIMINNGDVWTNSTNVILTLTYNDATSGISEVRYSNDGIIWSSWEAAVPTRVWILYIGDDSSKAIYYEIKDHAGRVSQYIDTIGLDTVNPDGSIIINDDSIWTNSTNVILTLTFNDIISGVKEVRYSNDGITWSSWEAAGPTKAWTLSIGDDPSKTVYYEIRDNAGRISQYTDTIGLDTVDPTGSIMINNGDVWTNSTNVILNLTYSDVTSGISEVRYSNDGITWSSWEAGSPTKTWTLSAGDGSSKEVYYKIKDNAGRISQYTDTIGLDTIDPIGSIIINGGDFWTISSSVTLTLTYDDITSGVYQVRYSNDGISWSSWEDPNNIKSWELLIGDGSKTVYYEIKDNAGLIFQTIDTIGLDTIDPSGSVVINNGDIWTNTSSVLLTLTYNDITSGIDQVRYSNDGNFWTAWEDPENTRIWILTSGDGYKTVYFELRDNAGLIFQTIDTIGLDTNSPTGSIIINNDEMWTISTNVILTLSYNDAMSGVNHVRYSNDGIIWSNWEDPFSNKTFTLTIGDGSKTVYYEIIDKVGIKSIFSDSIGLDTVDPIGSVIINNNDNWTSSIDVTLSLIYNDVTSGVAQVRYSNDGISWTSWEPGNSIKDWVLIPGDGFKTVYYEVKDNAGRISQFIDFIGLDTVIPTGSIITNNDDAWTTSINVTLTLNYDDLSSGIDKVRYSNDGSSWTSWEDPNSNRNWLITSGDGLKTIYYEIRDHVGLIFQTFDTIGLDTVKPTGSIIINNNDAWTITTNIVLTLTYNDATAGIDKVRYSNDGSSWTSWEDPSSSRTWTLVSGDGTKTVYYEIRDNAGLIFQSVDTINLDTTEPIGSVIISNNNIWSTSTNVILTLTYNDITSGVSEVRYSNDGTSWTNWEDPSSSRTWTLASGDGLKTVYFEIRDIAGLIFQCTDTIVLDTTGPTGSIIINDNDIWTTTTNVILALTYNDTTSGVNKVRYSNDGLSWTDWIDPTGTKMWLLTSGDGLKTVYYEIRDNVGFITQYFDTIGLDTLNPTGSIIINQGDAWTVSENITLTLTFNDATSGVDQVRYSNDGISWTNWEDPTITKLWVLSAGDGPSKTVYYELKDNTGRSSQFFDTIGLDTVDPFGSIEINYNEAWVNSTNVLLSLIYNDATSGVAQVRYSNDAVFWTNWEAPGTIKAWILPSGDSTSKDVYYEIKDNAGRVSQFIDSIGLDTASPTGSIEINGENSWVNSTNVLLSLTYNDATSGVAQVRYSNDGSSWTSWEDPIITRLWVLSAGDGSSKNVYYEIKDYAGQISQFADSIGLEILGKLRVLQKHGSYL
ncbi:MAG: hypothetical protein P8Y97_06035, partial [Candidatus Lokiarchaeota archaeon]